MSTISVAISILKKEEGFRSKTYLDSLGFPTIGYGLKLSEEEIPVDFPEIPEVAASAWLEYLVEELSEKIAEDDEVAFLTELDPIRYAVVLSMVYQLGLYGFKRFKNTIKYLEERDYDSASKEMLDSLWAEQTPARAKRQSYMIFSGVLLGEYV